jgi:hypothetical protein
MSTLLKVIKVIQKIAYFLGLACFGGLFVIGAQPKDPKIDKAFQILLAIGIVVCLGIIFGGTALERYISNRR